MSKVINFYNPSDDFGCFSNFSRHPIAIKGKAWPTSEHYFQAQKFVGTEHESKVRNCTGPKEAAAMGRDRKLPLRRDWESVKDDVMREAVYAKFSQHEDIKETLLSTGDATLVEHTEKDSYWGDGGDGSGKNMLGQILMEVRDRLKPEVSEEDQELIDKEALNKLVQEFDELVKKVTPQIEAELDNAKAAIARAVALAEEHGVPFTSDVYVWTGNNYIPNSFSEIREKMESLDNDCELDGSLEDVLGFSPQNYDYNGPTGSGWESDGWRSSSLSC